MSEQEPRTPEILVPAGNRESFLAAIAAEADAIYCGLKMFSARMAADNFSIAELAALTELAHRRGIRVYVALNTIVKPHELEKAARLIGKLARDVQPDALIVQDPAIPEMARVVGFKGELHLSTLGNASFPEGLNAAKKLGFNRVVMPRELDIDEMRAMSEACPPGMDLEAFVHGALCYAVSGRCYWSSFLGGKSGLRGRCVQPCRRFYKTASGTKRWFSMMDLSVDVLVKALRGVEKVDCWKIEGRKKGPHYVYYTTAAYKMLRDEVPEDSSLKKVALSFLEQSLGRPGMHYNLLPQRPWHPIRVDEETGSGRFAGRVKGGAKGLFFAPRFPLLPGDFIRVGYDEDAAHFTQSVRRSVPKGGKLALKRGKGKPPSNGTPVFLLDRREEALETALTQLGSELVGIGRETPEPADINLTIPKGSRKKVRPFEMQVGRRPGGKGKRGKGDSALWVDPDFKGRISSDRIQNTWWWVPPVIWPKDSEKMAARLKELRKQGATRFVLNAPWQIGFFPLTDKYQIWAGPYCNVSNGMAAKALKRLGFSGVIASPELSSEEFLALPKQSPLPVAAVASGFWPLAISRVIADGLESGTFFRSPKGEGGWISKHGNDYWLFPDWIYDIRKKIPELERAGYVGFIHFDEEPPKGVHVKERPGLWNWNLRLL